MNNPELPATAGPDAILRAAFDVMRVGICLIDARGCFVSANQTFCTMTGFNAGELTGKHWTLAAPAEIAARADTFLRAVFTDSPGIPDRWKLKRKDGSLIDALISFRPLQHAGEQFAVLSFSDITDAKRADDRIRDHNRDLERSIAERTTVIRRNRNVLLELAALEKSNRPLALQSILGAAARTLELERVSYWRLAGDATAIECEMLYVLSRGSVDAAFAGACLTAARYPNYFAAIVENRPVVAAEAQTHPATAEFAVDYLMPRKIGSMLDVPVWLRGKVVGVLCHEHVGLAREWTAEDIDFASSAATMISLTLEEARRHELNEALVRSEEKYRHVVENASEAILIAQDGRIRYANPQASRLSGYAPEELDAKPFLDFVYGEDKQLVAENYMKRLRGEAAATSYDFRIVDKQSQVRWLSINAVTLEWEGRPATLNFLTDITERRRAEEEVRRALAKERELNELKSRFVAMTSHEFRTPLATILSSTELLDRHHDRLPAEERHTILRRIATGVDRMAHMLDNVLTIGRAETEAMDFSPAPLDLPGLCRQLVDEVRAGADRDMHFEFSGEQTTVEMDEKLLRHALGNLLSNAVKYSRQGSRVTFNARVTDAAATFEIIDEGIGIPPQDHERLFEAFHRARNVGNIAGTGLGLAIVKKSVELHGGSIAFTSEIDRGTRFTVTLPLHSVTATLT
jgi:PAS domain S-box-containing protein